MSSLADQAALVTLLQTGKRPWNEYANLLEEAGSAAAVLDRERSSQASLFETAELAASADQITRWHADGIRLVSVLDPDYPQNLRAVHDRPPVIFVAGRLEPRDANAIAVVGARQASPRGIATAKQVSTHLAGCGFTVFSGLAAGIDTAVHNAALDSGGRTIAVVGTGLKRAYPPQNAPLQRRLAGECAVVSQFWPDAPPSKRSFPMRNAVMSGATLATVVIEASETSGARTQARLALAQGRPVFLHESLLEREWARDCAARPGAHVVKRPAEITETVERLRSADTLVG